MKVLLTLAPAWSTEYPYLGGATICGTLKQHGYECKYYDLNIKVKEKVPESLKILWEANNYNIWTDPQSFQSKVLPLVMKYSKLLIDEIESYRPDVLAFSLLISNRLFTEFLISQIKRKFPNLHIICGGPEVKDHGAEKLLKQLDVQATFYGDAEESLIHYLKNKSNDPIAGVCYKINDKIIYQEHLHANLNNTAFADFDDLDLNLYNSKQVLPINFSKGCIASCSFCNESRYNDTFRFRNAKRVIEEIELMQKKYKTVHFHCIDSLVNGNLKLLKEICELTIQKNLKFTWGGLARFTSTLTRKVLEQMHAAGCRYLSFGMESASQHVLDLMQKNVKVENIHRIVNDCSDIGIAVDVSLIVGFPGEEEEHFMETMNFLDKFNQKLRIITFYQTLSIIPNTYLFDHLDEFNVIYQTNGNDWITKDGKNTLDIRKERLKRLREKVIHYKLIAS